MSFNKFIMTNNRSAYDALVEAGFVGLGMLSSIHEPCYFVFNSPKLQVPDECVSKLVYTDTFFITYMPGDLT